MNMDLMPGEFLPTKLHGKYERVVFLEFNNHNLNSVNLDPRYHDFASCYSFLL